MNLAISSTKKGLILLNETIATCHVFPKNSPVVFGDLEAKLVFFVGTRVPVGIFIGIPELEKMNSHVCNGGQYINFDIQRMFAKVGLKCDCTTDRIKEMRWMKNNIP